MRLIKKLLGIVVLGLLFSGNGYAKTFKIGLTFKDYYNRLHLFLLPSILCSYSTILIFKKINLIIMFIENK